MHKLPRIELLNNSNGTEEGVSRTRQLAAKSRLLEKLAYFNVGGKIERVDQGPVITTYYFRPNDDVRYASVVKLADDIALGMETESVRISRAAGTGTIAIEVARDKRQTVYLRPLIDNPKFYENYGSGLRLALGLTSAGDPLIMDLTTAPHLLIAGATGAGKSVSLQSILLSLLYRYGPDKLELAMVDVKRVELGMYRNLPHVRAWGIANTPQAGASMLRRIETRIDDRYRLLERAGLRQVAPTDSRIVVVVDEFADLMMTGGKQIEESVIRIAQIGRAAGVHLIIATQRPTVRVVTGLIKANIHTRLCFKVSSRVDSQVVLDRSGAEQLLGRGDALLRLPDGPQLIRIHGPFVSDEELKAVIEQQENQ